MEKILKIKETSDQFAIATEQLIERTPFHRVLDIAFEVLESAPMYTLAHAPGRLLGAVEQRRIRSSFLSRKCKSLIDFYKMRAFFPSAAKNIHISCSMKRVYMFSRGAGHGFTLCAQSAGHVYLYDWYSLEYRNAGDKENLWQKKIFQMFSPMVKAWSLKKLRLAQSLWVSHPTLKNELAAYGILSKVVLPPVELKDFPLLSKNSLPKNYVVLNTVGMNLKWAKRLVVKCHMLNFRFVWVGPIPAWRKELIDVEEKLFWGDRCAGELAPLLAGANGVVDLSHEIHPILAIKSLSSGTPVLMPAQKDFIAGVVNLYDQDKLEICLDKLIHKKWDRQVLHDSVKEYDQRNFKQKLLSEHLAWVKSKDDDRRHDEAYVPASK